MFVKTCITCGVEKPSEDFYKRKESPDGFRNNCKTCQRAVSKRSYLKDVAESKAKRRSYYRRVVAENPNFHHEKYWSNPEKFRKEGRDAYKKNRQARIRNAVEYARENPAKANATKKKYKMAKQQACPPWVYSSRELCAEIEYFYENARQLTETTGVAHHVDHIIPIQGDTVCGLHVPWNLQVLTASENCSKQNKLLEESA